MYKRLLFSAVFLMTAAHAYADDKPDKVESIGSRLNSIISDNWNAIFLLIAAGCALAGLFMLCRGLVGIVSSASSGGRESASGPLIMIVAGAMLIALPDVAGIGMKSLFGVARGGATLGSEQLDYSDQQGAYSGDFTAALLGSDNASLSSPQNCLQAAKPAECMTGNLAKGTIPALIFFANAIAYIGGFWILGTTIINLARQSQGQNTGQGNLTKIAVAAALMNAPALFQILTKTILGVGNSTVSDSGALNSSSPLLKYEMGSGIQALEAMSGVLANVFTILVFFGVFAYLKGIFMLKGVAEGRSNGTFGQALVLILSGVLLANSKAGLCIAAVSFGVGQACGV